MNYMHYILTILSVLFIYIVIVKIHMWVTSYVGKQLGIRKFFIYLWKKIRKDKSGLK